MEPILEQIKVLGKYMGSGKTARVFRYDEIYAVKIYGEYFGIDLAKYEYGILKAINIAGAPAPEVIGLVQYKDSFGIKMEAIDGHTMDRALLEDISLIENYAKRLAMVQAKMHATRATGLPSQERAFRQRLDDTFKHLGDLGLAVLAYTNNLPNGDRVCHGDLHPKNLMVGGNKSAVIDWTNAYSGHPLGDVTTTCLRLKSPYVPAEFKGDHAIFIGAKKNIFEVYIAEYGKLTGITLTDLEDWWLPCAALQLKATKTVHSEWLLGIIEDRLSR